MSIFAGYFILHPSMNVYTVPMLWVSAITLLLSHHLFASIYHLYQKAWQYASVGELTAIVKAVTFSIAVTGVVQFIYANDVYFRVLGITWMLHVITHWWFSFFMADVSGSLYCPESESETDINCRSRIGWDDDR